MGEVQSPANIEFTLPGSKMPKPLTHLPIALDEQGIKDKVQAFKKAARNAIEAGFNGIEVRLPVGKQRHIDAVSLRQRLSMHSIQEVSPEVCQNNLYTHVNELHVIQLA
eukprot:1138995-Pelagomonas_calceolata.AAC.3